MIQLHEKQKEVVESDARFKVIRAGRRSGKTILEIEEMIFTAVSGKDRSIFYLAPTQSQARDIIWEYLKRRLNKIGKPNETRLEMRVPTREGGESIIYVTGWENRENFRGKKAHLQVFDELDTMKGFQIAWQEIFRPALMDTNGRATFIGTPKKENPNLRRLEKIAKIDKDYATFHFTTKDNPYVDPREIEKARKELEASSFKQEILAEYIDDVGALFNFSALVDVFSNTLEDKKGKYLTVDIADDGTDKTIFSFWEGLTEYQRIRYERLNTENIIDKIKEYAREDKIPYSHIAVDAIGVGAGVASSSRLDGIIGYKSSYGAIKTDQSIIKLPNVGYSKIVPLVSDYKNLRSQCVFTLSENVNNHKISSLVEGEAKERIIEELQTYQDISKGDGKRQVTSKEEIKEIIGRSPDDSDTWIMRMYFEIRNRMSSQNSEEMQRVYNMQGMKFDKVFKEHKGNTK